MNLLISDYDGTIKPYENTPNIIEKEIFKKNIKAINKFIENGNKFCIATGRSTDSIKEELKKFDINYNYLLSYNGRVILNDKDNLIYSNKLDNDLINYLSNKENFIKKIDLYNENGYTETEENIIYMYLFLNHIKDVKKYIIELKEKYPQIKIDFNIILRTMIIRNNFNKKLGIEELLKRENIILPKNKIMTVGDESNDIEMIEEYDGYRMLLSNPKLLYVTNKVTPSVHRLIKKLK